MGTEDLFRKLEDELRNKYLSIEDIRNLHEEVQSTITKIFKNYMDVKARKEKLKNENKEFQQNPTASGEISFSTERAPELPVSNSHLGTEAEVVAFLKENGISTSGVIAESVEMGQNPTARLNALVAKGSLIRQDVPLAEAELVFGKGRLRGYRSVDGKIAGYRAV